MARVGRQPSRSSTLLLKTRRPEHGYRGVGDKGGKEGREGGSRGSAELAAALMSVVIPCTDY